jgi:23S rRNA (adenine2503-C2)-methyltransferase
MDVTGLTFADVEQRLRPPAHELRAARRAYKRTMRGVANDGAFHVTIPAIVGQLPAAELTKFVLRTADGYEIEAVAVPMRQHGGALTTTLCVSSQVGCARDCAFCQTGQLGLVRNLTPAEIVGEVLAARDALDGPVRNIVFMGMGEPFDNFDNVIRAIRVLTDQCGLCMAYERITISTVGRVEGIRRLAAMNWRRLNLAVSLNAPNDAIRSAIMPHNRRESMAALRDAMVAYPLRRCAFIMIEYVLIPGVNDGREHAAELVEYLRPVKCCVNVIPHNPREGSPWPAPSEEAVRRFIRWVGDAGQPVKRRSTKGRDQMAACGQLGNRARILARPGGRTTN